MMLRSSMSLPSPWNGQQRQLTNHPYGHILTNAFCWSHCGNWIYYDVRSDPAGTIFDGTRIERVHTLSGEVECLYESSDGAHVGVVTAHPYRDELLFIHGPEFPTVDWQYTASHRRGVRLKLGALNGRHALSNLDACCVAPPFIAGALRGGSHVHTFDPTGKLVAFTYEDHVLAQGPPHESHDLNQRNVGVSLLDYPVSVPTHHPRNHSGDSFSVLVTRTVNQPKPGSDEISRAYEDAWIGLDGYLHRDGRKIRHALAFLGDVRALSDEPFTELFIVDLPEDLTQPNDEGPLEGTLRRRPLPPKGCHQRRVTFTGHRRFPGIQGPRHWPRSTPDGKHVLVLMRDDQGIVQLYAVSTHDGGLRQVSVLSSGIESAFTLSPDGQWIAHVAAGEICVTHFESGETLSLTETPEGCAAPRGEAVVFAPDGSSIAFVRPVHMHGGVFNQIFIVA